MNSMFTNPPRWKPDPGATYVTLGVIAGAYRGKDLDDRSLLTHLIEVKGDHWVGEKSVCRRVPLDNIVDEGSARDAKELAESPTCPLCRERYQKLIETISQTEHEARVERRYDQLFGSNDKNRYTENMRGAESIFKRTEAQAVAEDHRDFMSRVRERGFEDRSHHAVEPFAPGDLARAFHDAKAKRTATTLTEQQIVKELQHALPLGFVSNALLYSPEFRHMGKNEHKAVFKLLKGGVLRMVETRPSQYWLIATSVIYPEDGSEYSPNSGYYVWVVPPGGDEPLNEGPYGPHTLSSAKTYARISATEGGHDRVVTRGLDAESASFQVVRRYRARTGERLI